MSLIEWVEWDRNLIDALFDKPPFSGRKEMKAGPLIKNYSTVGSAFHYVLMLQIAHINSDLINDFPLTAEYGVKRNRKRKEFVDNFKTKRAEFFRGQLTLSELLPDCIVLAKLETVYRTKRNFPNSDIFSIDQSDVSDLQELSELFDVNLWRGDKQCILNPEFGKSSYDIKGADADLIIDDMLVDIKTTTELKFRREYFRQLAGYHLLNIREKNMHGEIRFWAIYFSRFGFLFKFPAPKMNVMWMEGKKVDLWKEIEDSIKEYQTA